MAPYPGGPMQAAREWPAIVAGQATTIIETRVFMGQLQRVMVAHLQNPIARDQEEKHADREVLERSDAAQSELGIVAEYSCLVILTFFFGTMGIVGHCNLFTCLPDGRGYYLMIPRTHREMSLTLPAANEHARKA